MRMYNFSYLQSDTTVLIDNAHKNRSYWDNFMTGGESTWTGSALSMRIGQISEEGIARSDDDRIRVACSQESVLSSFHLWIIVGEWTTATTDCAKYLHGRGQSARYGGSCPGKTGSGATFSEEYKTSLRKYWEAQTITFEKGDGWVQLTWKAEEADDWSYQAGLEYGWIPQDPTNRMYPGICDGH